MNFVDRAAGSVILGSNDMENWTRLTPEETPFTGDLAKIAVDDAYKDKQYRFIKIQMIDPQPDIIHNTVQNIMELGEFRIYGERHEIGNKLESVSLGSDQSVSGKISIGNTAKITIKAKEAIQNVKVKIQGLDATVTTQDNINWTAVAAMSGNVQTGPVKFTIDYQKSDGTNGDTTVLTTDNSKLLLVDGSKFINVPMLATVTASDKQWPGTGLTKEQVGYLLFDGKTTTFGDLNTASGSYYTVDFGVGASVKLNEIVLMPRSGFSARMNGLIVQGSNDNVSWTNLTVPLSGAQENTWSDIQSGQMLDHNNYRYLRLYNSSAWNGDVAEVEFYGDFDYNLDYVDSKVIAPDGYTKASYYLYQKEIERIKLAVSQPGADKTALLAELFQAKGLLVSVSTIYPKIAITSSMALASSISFDGKFDAVTNGWRAFDGDTSTSPDTQTASGWAQADLGADNAKVVGSIKFMPRAGNAARMNGALIQGSNDGTNFDTLFTISGISDIKWYTQPINSSKAYRYLRYYTPNGYANVGELEFYEKIVDRTLLALLLQEAAAVKTELYKQESADALQTAVSEAQSVYNNADATQSEIDAAGDSLLAALKGLQWKDITASPDPAAPGGKNGWYTSPVTVTLSPAAIAEYSLDGGSTWTAYSAPVTLNQEGTHQVLYRRSVDAGEAKTLEVKIDLTAPVVQITGAASYTIDQDVVITCSASDVISSVYGTPCGQPLVQAKAYTLTSGQHTVTVTAEDMAGHQTTVTHTFTVTVTFNSLKAVTTAFLQATGTKGWDTVAKSLNQKLDQAKAAVDSGKIDMAKSIMADYIGQVTDQTGKYLTQAQADILIRWAKTIV